MYRLRVFKDGADLPEEENQALRLSELEVAIAQLQSRFPAGHRIEVWFNGAKLFELACNGGKF